MKEIVQALWVGLLSMVCLQGLHGVAARACLKGGQTEVACSFTPVDIVLVYDKSATSGATTSYPFASNNVEMAGFTPYNGRVWKAYEYQSFSCVGDVLYGCIDEGTTSFTATGATHCSNSNAGDPLVGVLKQCWCRPTAQRCTLTHYSETGSGSEVTLVSPSSPSSTSFLIKTDSSYKKTISLTANFAPSLSSTTNFIIVVCGNEVLQGTAASLDLLFHQSAVAHTISSANYTSWFTLTTGSLSSPDCTITGYQLCQDANCDAVYTNANISLPAAANSTLTIDISSSIPGETFYLVAQTRGLVKASRKIKVEVCGYETISLSAAKQSLGYMLNTGTADVQTWSAASYQAFFSVDSINCPITAYSLLTHNGTAYAAYTGSDVQLAAVSRDLTISTASAFSQTVYIKAETESSSSVQYLEVEVLVCDTVLVPDSNIITVLNTFVGAVGAQAGYTVPAFRSTPAACNVVTSFSVVSVSPPGNATFSTLGCSGPDCRRLQFFTDYGATITLKVQVNYTSTLDSQQRTIETPFITVNVRVGTFQTAVIPAAPPQLQGVTSPHVTHLRATAATTPSNKFIFPVFQVNTLGYTVVVQLTSSSDTDVTAAAKVSEPVIQGATAEVTIDTSELTTSPIQFYLYGRTAPTQDPNFEVYYGFSQLVSIEVTCGSEVVTVTQGLFTLPVYVRGQVSGVPQQSVPLHPNIASSFVSSMPECPLASYQAFADDSLATQLTLAQHGAELSDPNNLATASLVIDTQEPRDFKLYLQGSTTGGQPGLVAIAVRVCGFEEVVLTETEDLEIEFAETAGGVHVFEIETWFSIQVGDRSSEECGMHDYSVWQSDCQSAIDDPPLKNILTHETTPVHRLLLSYQSPRAETTVCVKARTRGLAENSRLLKFKVCDASPLETEPGSRRFTQRFDAADQLVPKSVFSKYFTNPSPYCTQVTYALTSDERGAPMTAASGTGRVSLDESSQTIVISSRFQQSEASFTFYLEATRGEVKGYQRLVVEFKDEERPAANHPPRFSADLRALEVVTDLRSLRDPLYREQLKLATLYFSPRIIDLEGDATVTSFEYLSGDPAIPGLLEFTPGPERFLRVVSTAKLADYHGLLEGEYKVTLSEVGRPEQMTVATFKVRIEIASEPDDFAVIDIYRSYSPCGSRLFRVLHSVEILCAESAAPRANAYCTSLCFAMHPYFILPPLGQESGLDTGADGFLYAHFQLNEGDYRRVLRETAGLEDERELNEYCFDFLPFRISGTTWQGDTCDSVESRNSLCEVGEDAQLADFLAEQRAISTPIEPKIAAPTKAYCRKQNSVAVQEQLKPDPVAVRVFQSLGMATEDLKSEQDLKIEGITVTRDYQLTVHFSDYIRMLPKEVLAKITKAQFSVRIESALDGSVYQGSRNSVPEAQDDFEDEEVRNLLFSWDIVEFSEKGVVLQLNFLEPRNVSMSTEGADTIHFQLQDENLIVSNKGRFVERSSINKAVSAKLAPYLSRADQRLLSALGGDLIVSESLGGVIVNLIMSKYIQDFFGLLNSQQLIIYLGLLDVVLPGNALFLNQMLIEFTQKDLWPVEKIFPFFFNFTAKAAFSERFETFGIDSTNFVEMLGSDFLNDFAFVATVSFNGLLTFISIFNYKHLAYRQCGIKLPRERQNWAAFSLVLQQGFLFLVISCMVSYQFLTSEDFNNPSDRFAAILSLLVGAFLTILLYRLFRAVLYEADNFADPHFAKRHDWMVQDLKPASAWTRAYYLVYYLRRLVYALIVVLLSGVANVQLITHAQLAVFALIYVAGQCAYVSRAQNKQEVFNEVMVILVTYGYLVFANSAIPGRVRFHAGWGYVAAILFSSVTNFIHLVRVGFIPVIRLSCLQAQKSTALGCQNCKHKLRYRKKCLKAVFCPRNKRYRKDWQLAQLQKEKLKKQKKKDLLMEYLQSEKEWLEYHGLQLDIKHYQGGKTKAKSKASKGKKAKASKPSVQADPEAKPASTKVEPKLRRRALPRKAKPIVKDEVEDIPMEALRNNQVLVQQKHRKALARMEVLPINRGVIVEQGKVREFVIVTPFDRLRQKQKARAPQASSSSPQPDHSAVILPQQTPRFGPEQAREEVKYDVFDELEKYKHDKALYRKKLEELSGVKESDKDFDWQKAMLRASPRVKSSKNRSSRSKSSRR